MARPPSNALAQINAEQLARDTVSEMIASAYHALNSLDVGRYVIAEMGPENTLVAAPQDGRDWQRTVVGHAVYCLTRYAQTGADLDADVHEYLVSLIPTESEDLDDLESEDTGPIGIVVRAALAREAILEGRRTTLSRLAAVAGLTPRALRVLAQSGELTAAFVDGEWSVRAKDASRWLSGRGVPGFA